MFSKDVSLNYYLKEIIKTISKCIIAESGQQTVLNNPFGNNGQSMQQGGSMQPQGILFDNLFSIKLNIYVNLFVLKLNTRIRYEYATTWYGKSTSTYDPNWIL